MFLGWRNGVVLVLSTRFFFQATRVAGNRDQGVQTVLTYLAAKYDICCTWLIKKKCHFCDIYISRLFVF